MEPLVVVYEDAVHRAILGRIIGERGNVTWVIKNGKTEIDKRVQSYIAAAAHSKVIILRDIDNDAGCAPAFMNSSGLAALPHGLAYRLAIREAEAWVMADKQSFCEHFRCGYQRLERRSVESLNHPKTFLLKLILNGGLPISRKGAIVIKRKSEYVPGAAYNGELAQFISDNWSLNSAMGNSDSLSRAVRAINDLLSSS